MTIAVAWAPDGKRCTEPRFVSKGNRMGCRSVPCTHQAIVRVDRRELLCAEHAETRPEARAFLAERQAS